MFVTTIQLLVIHFFKVYPNWDFGIVFQNASDYALKGARINPIFIEYFQYFPNNILLFTIEVLFIKIGNLFSLDPNTSCLIMNIIFIDLALLFLFLVIKKKHNLIIAFKTLIITFFFLPLFLYTPIFYTDTMSLFIPILLLYLYINIDDHNNKKSYILSIVIGIILFFGWQMKVNSIFILIPIIIDYLLNHKKVIFKLISMFLTFIILNFTFTKFIINNENFNFQINSYGKYPLTHWIMMGVEDIDLDNSNRNCYGGYNIHDYELTKSYMNSKEASKFNIQEYKIRVKKMGLFGYINFLTKKLVNIFTDGYYFSDIKLDVDPIADNNVRDFFFKNKFTKNLLINFAQGVQYCFIMLVIITSFIKIKNKDNKFEYIYLTILGLILFFAFWEGRSRYIFNYIPIFIVLIVDSIIYIRDYLNKKKKN